MAPVLPLSPDRNGILAIGCQVSMGPRLAIMDWVLSDSPNHQTWESSVDFHQVEYQSQTDPSGTGKFHKQVALAPTVLCYEVNHVL